MCIICRNNTWDENTTRQLNISCSDIESIPAFTNTELVMLENCNNITYLPRLERLNNLYIIDCKSLGRINSYANLTKLTILNSPIVSIPGMRNLEMLDVTHCSRFTRIVGDMPSLISLTYRNCPRAILPPPDTSPVIFDMVLESCNIDTIPNYPMISHLWLQSMQRISEIPVLENLEYLLIRNCYLIATIPSIPSLERLIVDGTGGFFELPSEMHNLEKIELVNLWIKDIPYYPEMTKLSCFNCPMLERIHYAEFESLTLVDCPKIHSMPCPLSTLKFFRCDDNSPLRVYSRFFLPAVDAISDNERREHICAIIRLCFLQNKFRRYNKTRRVRKFISLCFSDPFCRMFWHPDGMGGRWHIRKMQEFTKDLLEEKLF